MVIVPEVVTRPQGAALKRRLGSKRSDLIISGYRRQYWHDRAAGGRDWLCAQPLGSQHRLLTGLGVQ